MRENNFLNGGISNEIWDLQVKKQSHIFFFLQICIISDYEIYFYGYLAPDTEFIYKL